MLELNNDRRVAPEGHEEHRRARRRDGGRAPTKSDQDPRVVMQGGTMRACDHSVFRNGQLKDEQFRFHYFSSHQQSAH